MQKSALGNSAYMLATFGEQSTSHFIINTQYYHSIGFLRQQPIFAFGLLSLIIQEMTFSYPFKLYHPEGATLSKDLTFGPLIAPLLTSSIALAKPEKYMIPDIPARIIVEIRASLVQYCLFGAMLAVIFRKNL